MLITLEFTLRYQVSYGEKKETPNSIVTHILPLRSQVSQVTMTNRETLSPTASLSGFVSKE